MVYSVCGNFALGFKEEVQALILLRLSIPQPPSRIIIRICDVYSGRKSKQDVLLHLFHPTILRSPGRSNIVKAVSNDLPD